ncbi:hypothetical protein MYX77_06480 [Acidobacteriia bacterium AH_259_A11_L15]|nr:hypothetical protein [Acidobacteriia bacterium AH_259_A11_L15]
MKRHIPGLNQETRNGTEIPDGFFLVRVEQARYRYHPKKPFFSLRFAILEPEELAEKSFSGRLYCTPKALWKLSWFLRDFSYDTELLGQEEVDEKELAGLRGVVKISHTSLNGHSYLNLGGFAPEWGWKDISTASVDEREDQP